MSSNRLSILMIVYNEADFVEYSIRAALPHVDDLVIVEGAFAETIDCGAEPRSTDETKEKIRLTAFKGLIKDEIGHGSFSFSKDLGDVYYIEANEKTDKDQRNVGLEKIKKLNPNGWLLIIDGDEIYTKENFEMIRNFMNLMGKQNKKAAYFKSLTFVNDMEHYTEQEFPRLFRITPECKFVDDNYMEWKDASWTLEHILKLPYLRYHHFAFCKSGLRFETKKKWWETRFPERKDFEYDWYRDEKGEIWSPNHVIREYTGKLPEILKDHPLYPKEKEITNPHEKFHHKMTGKKCDE